MTTKVPPQLINRPVVELSYRPASGSNTIAFTAGGWRTVNLDTKPLDGIGVTLSSNQVTGVPAGTYCVLHAKVQNYGGNGQALRLYDVTGAAELCRGTSSYHDGGTRYVGDDPQIIGATFTLAAASTLELQIYPNSSGTTASALGIPTEGSAEKFHELILEKVA